MDPVSLGMLAVLGAAFYFLLIRPQKQRQRAQAKMIAELGPGVRVMTGSGLYGTIVERLEGDVRLEVAPGVIVLIADGAIVRVVEPALPAGDPAPGEAP